MANRIKVQVLGNTYYVSTEREEEEMRRIERQLNDQLGSILEARPNLSTVDVLVVLALNLMDQLTGSEESTDRMREQLTQYLEDAAKARMDLDAARRESDSLQKETTRLQREIERLQKEIREMEELVDQT